MKENQIIKTKNNLGHDLGLRIIKCFNAIVMTIAFGSMWFTFYSNKLYSPFYKKGDYFVIGLFLIIYVLFGKTYEAFTVSYMRIYEMIYSQILTSIVSDVIMFIVTLLLMKKIPSFLPYVFLILFQVFFSAIWSILAHKWYFHFYKEKKTAVIYDMRQGLDSLLSEYDMSKKFKVTCTMHIQECLADINRLEKYDVVFLSGIHSQDRNVVIKYCILNGIQMFIIPRVGDTLMSGSKTIHMLHLPMMRLQQYNPSPEFLFIKRLFDIIVSLVAIIVLSPFMIITAVLVKSDGGPAFYKQIRLTKGGKEFKVIKFRSMRVDAEKDGVARLSSGDKDDRITKIGRIIRKIRFDELPQLFNILKGDMSIVGPRPERPEIAAQYEKELPEFKLRLQAKAGLTGYAQVYGKYNTTPYDKLQMDLIYIANPSLVEEFRIMFATVKILFMPESTEGIDVDKVTAMDCENKEGKI